MSYNGTNKETIISYNLTSWNLYKKKKRNIIILLNKIFNLIQLALAFPKYRYIFLFDVGKASNS